MKSKSFSKAKNARVKGKGLSRSVKYIKKQRIRIDRRLCRSILKSTHSQDKVSANVLKNDGNREVI